MIYVDPQSAIQFYRRRRELRLAPDLVRESEQARTAAELASVEAGHAPDDQGNWRPREPLPRAWDWPEPYGPDPVVFGVAPRFKGEWP